MRAKSLERLADRYHLPQHFYHIVPKGMKGKTIFPLSELEDAHPFIYKEEVKKYRDRKDIPNQYIKLLDCRWRDCTIFSTVSPIALFALQDSIGIEVDDVEVFQFPIERLKGREWCLYHDSIKNERYSSSTIPQYEETLSVPKETFVHYQQSAENKEKPLIFAGITHILLKGSFPIEGAEVLSFKKK